MHNNSDTPIIYTILPRALQEVDYAVKYWKIRLTKNEFALVIFITLTLWIGGGLTGIAEWRLLFGVKLEPLGYIIVFVTMVAAISIGHAVRPEGSIELVIKGLIDPTKYVSVGQQGDTTWYPSLVRPHYRHEKLKKISFSKGVSAIKRSFKPLGEAKKKKKPEKEENSTDE
jgi:hypothetical protein